MEPQNVGGRGELSALDCAETPRDIATIHEAIRRWPKRWTGQTPEMKAAIVRDLDAGRAKMRLIMDHAHAGDEHDRAMQAMDRLTTAVKTHLMIEEQQQRDTHKQADILCPSKGVTVNTGNTVQVVILAPKDATEAV